MIEEGNADGASQKNRQDRSGPLPISIRYLSPNVDWTPSAKGKGQRFSEIIRIVPKRSTRRFARR